MLIGEQNDVYVYNTEAIFRFYLRTEENGIGLIAECINGESYVLGIYEDYFKASQELQHVLDSIGVRGYYEIFPDL